MRSKANFKSHPIHPMLVAFPVAFIFGAVVSDVAGVFGEWELLWSMGAYLSIAAVVTGLAAGVAGFLDYLYVVPPKSSGKRRATWHMVVNVLALAAIAAGWFFRDWETLRPATVAVLLEAVSAALVTCGGWMGGTLVYRNQIGVDHRYAHAGKWREVTADGRPGELAAVEGASQLKPGQMMLVHAGERRIVVARTDQGYAAFDDRCTHRGASLADGTLACTTVTCPWHGSQFDVTNGAVQAGPTEEPISTYRVEASNGRVQLMIPASG
jgi:uncharacterized membrane protein/nitrite reductase/ring-hydroxylating ferredoxin subunit